MPHRISALSVAVHRPADLFLLFHFCFSDFRFRFLGGALHDGDVGAHVFFGTLHVEKTQRQVLDFRLQLRACASMHHIIKNYKISERIFMLLPCSYQKRDQAKVAARKLAKHTFLSLVGHCVLLIPVLRPDVIELGLEPGALLRQLRVVVV